jgi:hypothetical protein
MIRDASHLHRRSAGRAAEYRKGSDRRLRSVGGGQPPDPAEREPDDHPQLFQVCPRVVGHPAVVADLAKARRQDVLRKAPDKLIAGDSAGQHCL